MLKNISSQTFAGILTELMKDKNIDINSLSIICKNEGKNISERSIYRYRTGEHVPSLETCIFILNCLEEKVSINEITKCLEVSTNYRESLRYIKKKTQFSKNITIQYDEFNINIDPEYLFYLISDKASSKYPDSNKAFSLYVRDLIVNDIKDDLPKNK